MKTPIVMVAFGTTTKARSDIELKPPYQVLSDLWAKGHQWAVVQSMHLICGHEFYRQDILKHRLDEEKRVYLFLDNAPSPIMSHI